MINVFVVFVLYRAFAQLYDSFVGDSFRVVNDMDVVARLPRGMLRGIPLDYCHAGRTVMVVEDPAETPWIEGEASLCVPSDKYFTYGVRGRDVANRWCRAMLLR